MSEETEKEPKADEEVTEESATETPASENAPAVVAAEEAAPEEAAPEVKAEEEIAEEKVEEKEEAPAATEEKETVEAASEDSDDEAEEADSSDSSDDNGGDDEARFDKLAKAKEILRESGSSGGSRRGGTSEEADDSFEKVIHINRCAKVVKGGRRFSFSALVVTGDGQGQVGFGFGKAKEVIECIKKASEAAKKSMVTVQITENTIPHRVIGEHGGGRVLLRPASPGTGLIAGGGVRAVVEAAGIKDVLAKSMGSNNQANVVKATIDALEQLRSKEEIYKLRGKKTAEQKSI